MCNTAGCAQAPGGARRGSAVSCSRSATASHPHSHLPSRGSPGKGGHEGEQQAQARLQNASAAQPVLVHKCPGDLPVEAEEEMGCEILRGSWIEMIADSQAEHSALARAGQGKLAFCTLKTKSFFCHFWKGREAGKEEHIFS